MPTRFQLRRGTTSQHASFTGASGEVTYDTDRKSAKVHNGSTVGGYEMARADVNNVTNPDFNAGNESIVMPKGVSAARPANPSGGEIRYNESTGIIEAYSQGGWHAMGSFGKVSRWNKTTISSITSGINTLANVYCYKTSANSKFLVIFDFKISMQNSGDWGGGHLMVYDGLYNQIHYATSSGAQQNSSHGGLHQGQHHRAIHYGGTFVHNPTGISAGAGFNFTFKFDPSNYAGENGYINRAYSESTTYSGTGGSAVTVIELIN